MADASPQFVPDGDLPPLPDLPVVVRTFVDGDAEACRGLYEGGLLPGRTLAANDTAADMDDIASAYAAADGHALIVAEGDGGKVLGMIGIQRAEPGVAEVRRLRVHRSVQRRGIGSKLLRAAIAFCRENGYLKVTVDTHLGRLAAMQWFERAGLKLERTRTVGDRETRYYYLDLYHTDERPRAHDNGA